jgi:hypothetical protein
LKRAVENSFSDRPIEANPRDTVRVLLFEGVFKVFVFFKDHLGKLSLVICLKNAAKVRKKVHLYKPWALFSRKNAIFCIFCTKNLVISKKSSTFAAAFDRGRFFAREKSAS